MSTTDFTDSFQGDPLPPYIIKDNSNTYIPQLLPDYINKIIPTGPEGTNFVLDKSTMGESDAPSIL